MVFRKCPNHGWLRTSEYTVCEFSGETICPECGIAVHGYKEKTPAWYNKKRSSFHEFEPPLQVYGSGNPLSMHDKLDDEPLPDELEEKVRERLREGLMEFEVGERILGKEEVRAVA
jgi:hypothetical protein